MIGGTGVVTSDTDPDVIVTRSDHAGVAVLEVGPDQHGFFHFDVLASLAERTERLAENDVRAVVPCSGDKDFCAAMPVSRPAANLGR